MSGSDAERLSQMLDRTIAQAQFSVETLATGDMELTSRRHLRWPTTVENRTQLDAPALRKFYDEGKYGSRHLRVRVNGTDNETNFQHCLEELASEISRYNIVHNRKISHALPDFIEGPSYYEIVESGPNVSTAESDVKDFVKYLVMQAVLTDTKAASTTFVEWSQGNDLSYETQALIGGIKIDHLICLDEGVKLKRLPDHMSGLSERLPRHASIKESDYLGRVLLVVKSSVEPALWNPSEKRKPTASWALGKHTIRGFCKALSVICDTEIQEMLSWEDYGHFAAFRTASATTTSTAPYWTRQRDNDVHVEKREIESAFDLLDECKDKNNLLIGMDQWVKSKGYMSQDVDSLIYLRTALEAVLLPADNKSELKYRLAVHGARLLGSNEEDRTTYYHRLRKLYNLSSEAVHNGKIKHTKENRELLEFGQNFCRNAIIKLAKYPKRMNWESVVMG